MNHFMRVVSLMFFAVLFLGACSAQRGNTGPSLAAWKGAVKGQWTLNSINQENFPSGASVKNIFDEAPMECFIGSQWNLTASGKGSITFTESGTLCSPGVVREIFWSLNKDEITNYVGLQFKKILPGDKARDVTTGYHLDLESAGEGRMTVRMPLDVGGANPGYLVFNFAR
ncbi:MAG TPA: hypothetical protein VKZ95_01150 [Sphingobacteriaceae bacterium]|nr:hypothetical protein [Sphingobacteriaceae bacterium]